MFAHENIKKLPSKVAHFTAQNQPKSLFQENNSPRNLLGLQLMYNFFFFYINSECRPWSALLFFYNGFSLVF